MSETAHQIVELRELRPRERCLINGYLCEVIRQARRTTFVREIGGQLEGNISVQMARKTKVVRSGTVDIDKIALALIFHSQPTSREAEAMRVARESLAALRTRLGEQAARNETLEQALGPDLAGRPLADLLRSAAEVMNYAGYGPMADCLRGKADVIAAALSSAPFRRPLVDNRPDEGCVDCLDKRACAEAGECPELLFESLSTRAALSQAERAGT